MMCIPKDVSWSIMKYNDVNENLILSDLEELKGLPTPKSAEGNISPIFFVLPNTESGPDSKYRIGGLK